MSSLKTKSSSRSNSLAAHLTRLRAPAVHGVYAPVHDVAAAAVIIRIVVRIVIIGVVVPVRPVAIAPPIALASELVIVISPNDGAGTKTAESATIVNDGGARAKAMEAIAKSTAVEAAATKAAAMATTTASAPTTCQRHSWRGQADGCNSQRDHCVSQHLISPSKI
jgi:hypothetical protein